MKNKHFIVLFGAPILLNACKPGINESNPNIILIVADDMGYSDLSCYGSEIQTPNIDKLAYSGKRFTQFYNQTRCCPSRASLLTGLYQHQVGIGGMTEGQMYPDSTLIPSYIGYLNRKGITIAEALRENGYQTFMSGKWHLGDPEDTWPVKRGFDKTFSLIWGCSNYFNTKPYLNENQEVIVTLNGKPVQPEPGFYFTNEFTKYALKFIEEKDKDKPFFLYLAYTAPHWPIQALNKDIELYKGKYMMGWDSLRMQRFERMKEMGIIPADTRLSPKYDQVPDWNALSEDEKQTWDLRMAVYAAMIHRMDIGIGKVVEKLKEQGELENTIIMFLSDNGATNAAIYSATQWIADRSGAIGTEQSFDAYGYWANTSNTPFRKFKSHTFEGGIITPFIFHWPAEIKPGLITGYPGHINDVMPTLLDITGTQYPVKYQGHELIPLEGTSLLPLLNGEELENDRTLFWEHLGNKAVRKGDWKMVFAKSNKKWYLYNLAEDNTEVNDLSEDYPEKVEELKHLYDDWAERVGALPDTLYKDLVLVRNADWFE